MFSGMTLELWDGTRVGEGVADRVDLERDVPLLDDLTLAVRRARGQQPSRLG
jgi:hypothetical protein